MLAAILYHSMFVVGEGGGKRRTVVVIVTYHDLLWLAVFAHLAPKVLVESIEVVLELRRVHVGFGIVGGVLVEVGEEDGLAVGGLDMFAGAAVAVSAGTDFVVETAVYFVLFCAEDGGEVAEGRREMLVLRCRRRSGGQTYLAIMIYVWRAQVYVVGLCC